MDYTGDEKFSSFLSERAYADTLSDHPYANNFQKYIIQKYKSCIFPKVAKITTVATF